MDVGTVNQDVAGEDPAVVELRDLMYRELMRKWSYLSFQLPVHAAGVRNGVPDAEHVAGLLLDIEGLVDTVRITSAPGWEATVDPDDCVALRQLWEVIDTECRLLRRFNDRQKGRL